MSSSFVLIGFTQYEDLVKSEFDEKHPWMINKIGGTPVFSPNIDRLEKVIQDQLKNLTCQNCTTSLSLVIQIYCPVDDKPDDRVLYIFACVNRRCESKKWLVLRCMSPVVRLVAAKKIKKHDSWIGDQDDWGDDELPEIIVDDTYESKSLNCIAFEANNKFTPLYLMVDEEANLLAKDVSKNSSISTKGDAVSEAFLQENYEKTLLPGTDEISHKFTKSLIKCPYQCIRYSWSGTAILNRSDAEVPVTTCSHCGSERTFELQIMPAILNYLRGDDENLMNDIDFGTILVYSCAANCSSEALNIEYCLVLDDPDNDFLSSKLKNSANNSSLVS